MAATCRALPNLAKTIDYLNKKLVSSDALSASIINWAFAHLVTSPQISDNFSVRKLKRKVFNYILLCSVCYLLEHSIGFLWSCWPSTANAEWSLAFAVLEVLAVYFLKLRGPLCANLSALIAITAGIIAITSLKGVDIHIQCLLQSTFIITTCGYLFERFLVPVFMLIIYAICLAYRDPAVVGAMFHFLVWHAGFAIVYEYTIASSANQTVRATEQKTAILASVSHDLRTPLNGIMGAITLIKRAQAEDPSTRDTNLMNIVQSSASQMLILLNDILDMSKISAGGLILHTSPCSIIDIIKEAIGTISPLAIVKRLDIFLRVQDGPVELCSGRVPFDTKPTLESATSQETSSKDLPGLVMIDKTRVFQILTNLLANSYKFTEKGHILVSCRFDRIQQDTEIKAPKWNVKIMVQDTGIGLNEVQLYHIHQLRTKTTVTSSSSATSANSQQGWGLGLQIAHSIAKQMNGKLTAESEGKDLGATFTLCFPATEVFIADLHIEEPSAQDAYYKPSIDLTGCRVLVADDDSVNQIISQQMLIRIFKCQVDLANNGEQAVEMIKNGGFNLYTVVLLDLLMPKMTGEAAAEQIRKMGCQVPIIALSANLRPDASAETYFNDYLEKPLCMSKLGSALEKVVPKSYFINKSHQAKL